MGEKLHTNDLTEILNLTQGCNFEVNTEVGRFSPGKKAKAGVGLILAPAARGEALLLQYRRSPPDGTIPMFTAFDETQIYDSGVARGLRLSFAQVCSLRWSSGAAASRQRRQRRK